MRIEVWCVEGSSEAGSYLRLTDSGITQLKRPKDPLGPVTRVKKRESYLRTASTRQQTRRMPVSWFRVQSPGCRVQGSGCRIQGSGCRVQGSGCRVQDSGFRVQGSGCRVQGPGLRVQGAGFRVQGLPEDCFHAPVGQKTGSLEGFAQQGLGSRLKVDGLDLFLRLIDFCITQL